eukprot:gene34287-40128_t
MTPIVQAILDKYESDSPATKANLARILMHGKLGGTGKLVILPVDQGFEHGPARSFAAIATRIVAGAALPAPTPIFPKYVEPEEAAGATA